MGFRVSSVALAATSVVLSLVTSSALAQIAVSAHDNKVVNDNGANVFLQNARADTVTILDLGVSPPKIIGEVNAPNSVVGPPQSVAVAPDESIAVVSAATKNDPADAKKQLPDNRLTVIDLKA